MNGKLTAEQVWRAVDQRSVCVPEKGDKEWQAIADELNAMLESEREKQLENLLRDACWLITRAAWPTESVDEAAADWYTHIHAMGIEVDA